MELHVDGAQRGQNHPLVAGRDGEHGERVRDTDNHHRGL